MGDLFGKIIKTTGDAKRESGEDINWRDVDYDKLKASRHSHPQITSWDLKPEYRNDYGSVPVNDSKGGVGGWIHPSTEEVRQSLRPVVETIRDVIDPYTGFSEAFMSNQTPMSNQPTPLPSSQGSVSPISQARDLAKEDTVTEYMGRPLSDDDDDSPSVGQIL
jgi:hypothetical protein